MDGESDFCIKVYSPGNLIAKTITINGNVALTDERQLSELCNGTTVSGESGEVPAQLDTPRARELWQMAIAQGWVDEKLQPLLSRPLAALLADRMAEVLGVATKWKVFEQLWRRKNMRNDYNTALEQQQCDEYMKKFKRIIS